MKITLEFGDDDRDLALRAIHGSEAFRVLAHIDNTLRTYLKHGDERFTDVTDLLRYVRDEIRGVMVKVEE